MLLPPRASAQNRTAAQQVRIMVEPIIALAVVGEPRPLILAELDIPGDRRVRDHTSYYDITTNVEGLQLWVEIDKPMPGGTHLFLSGETTLGEGHGSRDISNAVSGVRLVSAIGRGLENGRSLAYEFVVADGIDVLAIQYRTVTVRLMDPITNRSSKATQTIVFGIQSVPLVR